MTNQRRREKSDAAPHVSDDQLTTSSEGEDSDVSEDLSAAEAVNEELFGLNEAFQPAPAAGHWPTGAELTETESSPSRVLSGAADWVLQLDDLEIEFAGVEGTENSSKGSRIQMWDGSELIFEDDAELASETSATKGKRKDRG